MRYEELRTTLKAYFSNAVERRKAGIADSGKLGPLDISALENGKGFAEDAISTNGEIFDGLPESDFVSRLAKKLGISTEHGSESYALFQGEVQRAYRDYCSTVLDYNNSLNSYDLTDNKLSENAPASMSVTNPTMPLRLLVEKFIAEELRAANWGSRTEDQKRQYLELLQEILGADRDVSNLRALDAQRVKEVLLKYPKNRNKLSTTRNAPIEQLMEMTGVETLTIRTVNSYLQTYGSMFAWAQRNQYVLGNPFSGITVRERGGSSEQKRGAFSATHVRLILTEISSNALNTVNKDYQKWGPLIGLYTGARLNEVSQLQLEDLVLKEGVWCFDINDNGQRKRLKNAASRRIVPVHSKLLEHGMLEHIEQLRVEEETSLFPDFSYSAKEGYGRTLGRWFNDRFLVKLNIKNDDLVFHSFRHTMVTRLLRGGATDNVVKAIVGHTRQGVTQEHYFRQGYTVRQLQDILETYDPTRE